MVQISLGPLSRARERLHLPGGFIISLFPLAMSRNIKYPTLAGDRVIPSFEKRDAVLNAFKGTIAGSLFGLNVVLIKSSLSPSRSLLGGLRGSMGKLALFSLVGTAYAFGEAVSANLRQQETAKNSFAGGALAGAIIGAYIRNGVAKSVGGALLVGTLAATITWGFDRGREDSLQKVTSQPVEISPEHPKQGFYELVYRRPLSQTVAELGDLAKQIVRD